MPLNGFFACICLLCSVFCYSQSDRIGSKKQALEMLTHKTSDSVRQNLYNYIGEAYFKESFLNRKMVDSAFYYLRKGVYIGDSVNSDNKEITNVSLCLLAETYIYTGDTATAKKICMQVVRIYHRYNQGPDAADTWRMLASDLWDYNIEDKMIPVYYDSAIDLYTKAKQARKIAQMRILKMNFLSEKGNRPAAEEELKQVVKLAGENKFEDFSTIYQLLANDERYKGNLNIALGYALEAVKYADRSKDKNVYEQCHGELAQVYEELGEPDKSVYWYKKCIAERKNKLSQYIIYRTTSLMVVQMIKGGQAREALKLLLQMAKEDPPKGLEENATLCQSLAYCYMGLKQYKQAEQKYIEMINAYREGQFHSEILHIAYYDIGKFYVDIRQYDKAGPYLDKALEIGRSTIGRTKDLQLLLFKVDSAKGNFVSAIKHFQSYKDLNDTLFNQAKSKQIEELMIRYETEKKDRDITMLENESKLQKGELEHANQTQNWIIGVAALFLVIIALLINNTRLKQRTNRKLQAQQKEIERQNLSLQHLVKEKDWLVKEIHHRVKNNFHIVAGLLGTQSEYLKTEEAIKAVTESRHRVHSMSLIHQKLYQSDNLSAINMVEYIHELVDYLKDSFNIRQSIQFNLQIDRVELALSHCIPLGLILNEAITNSIKYAFPGNKRGIVDISLKRISQERYRLIISDNGIGLPPNADLQHTASMGMRLMKGLSDDIEGYFTINRHSHTEIIIDFMYNPGLNERKNTDSRRSVRRS